MVDRDGDLAIQLMAVEIIQELLASTTDGKLPAAITEQLREITGAAVVLLLEYPPDGRQVVSSVCPERKRVLFDSVDVSIFSSALHGKAWRSSAEYRLSGERVLDSFLSATGIGNFLSLPLMAAGELVGAVMLFDLPEPENAEAVLATIGFMAPVMGLSLRNSMIHRELLMERANLEARVLERTAALGREVAERAAAQAKLQVLLDEKDVLLRELFHRTKNTLEVVRSMLGLQALDHPDNSELQVVLEGAMGRIGAIAAVHRQLYSRNDLSTLNARIFMDELVHGLTDAYAPVGCRVAVACECLDCNILIDTAMPLALLVNELVSNSCKHAFRGRRQGQVTLRLTRETGGNGLDLHYSDDGPGLAPGVSFEGLQSLGHRLIAGLARDQLGGTMTIEAGPGFGFRCVFPLDRYDQRV
jgi:two-component sensor histidine kinase